MEVLEKVLPTGGRNVLVDITVRLERGSVQVEGFSRHDGEDRKLVVTFCGPRGGILGSATFEDPTGLRIMLLHWAIDGEGPKRVTDLWGNTVRMARDWWLQLRGPRGHMRAVLQPTAEDLTDIAAAIRFVWEATE